MTLGAVARGKRLVLVLPQQALDLRSMRIVAGGAIGIGQGAATMGFLHGDVFLVAFDAQGRHTATEEAPVVGTMAVMAIEATTPRHWPMHHCGCGPFLRLLVVQTMVLSV